MRDWEAERAKPKVSRTYKTNGETFSRGPLKPYNELVNALGNAAKEFGRTPDGRKRMRKLAWFLGERGETHACEAIMEHAREPAIVQMMYGPF